MKWRTRWGRPQPPTSLLPPAFLFPSSQRGCDLPSKVVPAPLPGSLWPPARPPPDLWSPTEAPTAPAPPPGPKLLWQAASPLPPLPPAPLCLPSSVCLLPAAGSASAGRVHPRLQRQAATSLTPQPFLPTCLQASVDGSLESIGLPNAQPSHPSMTIVQHPRAHATPQEAG